MYGLSEDFLNREQKPEGGGGLPTPPHPGPYRVTSKKPPPISLNYSKDMLIMVGYHFFSLDKNRENWMETGWNFKMADINIF